MAVSQTSVHFGMAPGGNGERAAGTGSDPAETFQSSAAADAAPKFLGLHLDGCEMNAIPQVDHKMGA